MEKINMKVNGKNYTVEIEADTRLIDLLRDQLRLIGTKEGCGEGECGACTVIMEGKLVNSCMVMAFQAEGREILTIEGLETEKGIDPIQQAFIDEGAIQCGFCTPGMVLAAKAVLDKNRQPTREEIREGISGNLCRCTGYNKIVDAVEKAARHIQERGYNREIRRSR